MIHPKLVSVATKFGELLFPPHKMMRDHLGLSQRQRVEAMAERRQATPCTPWEKIMDGEVTVPRPKGRGFPLHQDEPDARI